MIAELRRTTISSWVEREGGVLVFFQKDGMSQFCVC